MSNKLSDLLDQLAEELPENETVKAAQDEYALLYSDEAAEDDMGTDPDAPASDDVGVDEGPKGFDDLMAEDSADAPMDEENPMDAIFGKAKPKADKDKAKKPNPFADM